MKPGFVGPNLILFLKILSYIMIVIKANIINMCDVFCKYQKEAWSSGENTVFAIWRLLTTFPCITLTCDLERNNNLNLDIQILHLQLEHN